MKSYTADDGSSFMVYHNLRQAHLQEVGMTQISANHVEVKGLRRLGWPSDESEEPSQLHGHGP